VAEKENQSPAHEETIVPVKPILAAAPAAAQTRPARARQPRLFVAAALVVTVLLALAVVFILPSWVDDQQPEVAVVEAPVEAVVIELQEPVLTAEELETLRTEAEALLAELLTQQARLAELSAVEWGELQWEAYEEQSRDGDDAYLADAFQDAVRAYASALETGAVLLARGEEIVAAALRAADTALGVGNARLAGEQFQLVLGIEVDNARAQAGVRRAENLPEVLVRMRQGEAFDRDGNLEDAAQAYRDALDLDPEWQLARSALSDVNARIASRRFDRLVSSGFGALAEEEYDDASEHFAAALVLRPESSEARDGQIQAEQGQKLDQIALVEARALAFERRELWEQAIGLYRELLATDESLAFAQAGLERSVLRADLDAKLANLISNPTLLFDDRVLSDAGALLSDAKSLEDSGPRLGAQITDLDRLVILASTPVPVAFHSDALTNVTVYRVGELGVFAETEVELRPGNYTVVGSRSGFRDVRATFTVLPGRELAPVDVRCVEPIG
jgi:hypothetical protein